MIGVQYGENIRTSSPGSSSVAKAEKRPCIPPLTTIGLSSSAGIPFFLLTFSTIARRSSGTPEEGA